MGLEEVFSVNTQLKFIIILLQLSVSLQLDASEYVSSFQTLNLTTELYEGSESTTAHTKAPQQSEPMLVALGWPNDADRLLSVKTSKSYRVNKLDNSSWYQIAIHLKSYEFSENDYILLETYSSSGVRTEIWNSTTLNSDQSESENNESLTRHSGDKFVSPKKVLDGLEALWIHVNFADKNSNNKNKSANNYSSKSSAEIVVNLYEDRAEFDDCGGGFFDCRQPLCPDKCCTDVKSSHNSLNKQTDRSAPLFHNVWRSSAGGSRCIPLDLMCDGNPNCGMEKNSDETNEVCHPVDTCKCKSVCLTWNYVLTSLAIAVLFIITPTAIVFALFHRRNVALERARLLRLAQQRMADMQGEFTRDSPSNDFPPDYDEVFDTKEPPPCFCKAMAIEMGVDVVNIEQQQNLQENMLSDSVNTNTDNVDNAGTVREEGNGRDNLGFRCSCVNRGSVISEPPDYFHVQNEGVTTVSSVVDSTNNSNLVKQDDV